MAKFQRYTERIEDWCKASGVEIPPGFYRHSASRYVAIDISSASPRLIAKTWFNQEDVVYYLMNMAEERKLRLLDFKERCELTYNGKKSLVRGNEF
jgi:hypothetical protein